MRCQSSYTLGRAAVLTAIMCTACIASPQRSHPAALTGRWVRQISGATWGDTLLFEAEGGVRGSSTNPVPGDAQWAVEVRDTGHWFCAFDSHVSSCKRYSISGDSLVLEEGNRQQTIFRRLP
jgi:hypothetical protein